MKLRKTVCMLIAAALLFALAGLGASAEDLSEGSRGFCEPDCCKGSASSVG